MKIVKKLIRKFRSKTPVYVKSIQALSAAISFVMLKYDTFPDTFKIMSPKVAEFVMYGSLVIIFITQFIEKKNEKDIQ